MTARIGGPIVGVVCLAVWLIGGLVRAQDASPAAPALTDLQRATIQTWTLRIENAQLRAQAAQRDFDDARRELAALVRQLEVPGYVLDWQALTYRPAPAREGSTGAPP